MLLCGWVLLLQGVQGSCAGSYWGCRVTTSRHQAVCCQQQQGVALGVQRQLMRHQARGASSTCRESATHHHNNNRNTHTSKTTPSPIPHCHQQQRDEAITTAVDVVLRRSACKPRLVSKLEPTRRICPCVLQCSIHGGQDMSCCSHADSTPGTIEHAEAAVWPSSYLPVLPIDC